MWNIFHHGIPLKPVSSGLSKLQIGRMMARVDENIKSVRFSTEIDERLAILSRKLGRTKRMLVIQMVDYFYKSKKDPADLNDEVLKKELSSGVNRILSFIRKQEGDLLVPIYSMSSELITMTKLLGSISKVIAEGQLKGNAVNNENLEQIKMIDNQLKQLMNKVGEKDILKSNFRKILEHYITQRETLVWSVSAAKKEELAKQVRNALDKL
ncbi:BfmA/BtgA family mobilization protein [Sphingobacterium bovistauri]|nr:BfmA/BtgA family mobilization protein [Sphingobacterium bovistauri]